MDPSKPSKHLSGREYFKSHPGWTIFEVQKSKFTLNKPVTQEDTSRKASVGHNLLTTVQYLLYLIATLIITSCIHEIITFILIFLCMKIMNCYVTLCLFFHTSISVLVTSNSQQVTRLTHFFTHTVQHNHKDLKGFVLLYIL